MLVTKQSQFSSLLWKTYLFILNLWSNIHNKIFNFNHFKVALIHPAMQTTPLSICRTFPSSQSEIPQPLNKISHFHSVSPKQSPFYFLSVKLTTLSASCKVESIIFLLPFFTQCNIFSPLNVVGTLVENYLNTYKRLISRLS